MNILEQARGIIYDKSEEKERQYGDFFENMEDAARIASVMSKKQFTAEDIYHASSDRLTSLWGSNYTTPLVTSDYVRNISMSPTYFTNVKKDS
jgi:hypothetical protein